jgi:hypothetical protein
MLNNAAASVANRTGTDLLDQHMFLFLTPALRDAPATFTGLAWFGRCAAFAAAAVTGMAAHRMAQANLLLAAARHPLQCDIQRHFDIRSARRSDRAATMEKTVEQPSSTEIEIKPAENVVEIDSAEQVFAAKPFHSGESARVILGTFFRVGQDGIGLGDFLEALLGPRFFVAIRVVFQREVAEGILDRLLVGIFGNAQYLIIIALSSNDCSP